MSEFIVVSAWWQRCWLKGRALFYRLILRGDADKRLTELFFEQLLRAHLYLARLRIGKKHRKPALQLPVTLVLGKTAAGKSSFLASSQLHWCKATELLVNEQNKSAAILPKLWLSKERLFCEVPAYYFLHDNQRSGFYFSRFLHFYKAFGYFAKTQQIIHVINFESLLTQSPQELSTFFTRTRHLLGHLSLSVNIYLLVTQLDRLQGFSEFFGGLSFEERQMPCGLAIHGHDSVLLCERQFDLFLQRLYEQLLWRSHSEPLLSRRLLLLEFPRQLTVLKNPLLSIVKAWQDIKQVLTHSHLHGVYWISTVQQGKLVDVLQSEAERFCRPASKTTLPILPQRRTYFVRGVVQHLLAQPMLEIRRFSWRLKRKTVLALSALAIMMMLGFGAVFLKEWLQPELVLRSRPDLAFALATAVEPQQALHAYVNYSNPHMPVFLRDRLAKSVTLNEMVRAVASKYVASLWQKQIVVLYQQNFAHRYPLDKAAKKEINWQLFDHFYGPTGQLRLFELQYLKPAQMAHLSISPKIFVLYQALNQLQDQLYTSNGHLAISYTIYPTKAANKTLQSFSLNLAGQTLNFKAHTIVSQVFVWPTEKSINASGLIVTQKDKQGMSIDYQGDWSWLRLLESFNWQKIDHTGKMIVYDLTLPDVQLKLTLMSEQDLQAISQLLSQLIVPNSLS